MVHLKRKNVVVCGVYLNKTCKYSFKNKCAIQLGFLNILDVKLLSDPWLANTFFHFVDCLFTLLTVCCAELFSLSQSHLSKNKKSHLSIFTFIAYAFGVKPKRKNTQNNVKETFPCFFFYSS